MAMAMATGLSEGLRRHSARRAGSARPTRPSTPHGSSRRTPSTAGKPAETHRPVAIDRRPHRMRPHTSRMSCPPRQHAETRPPATRSNTPSSADRPVTGLASRLPRLVLPQSMHRRTPYHRPCRSHGGTPPPSCPRQHASQSRAQVRHTSCTLPPSAIVVPRGLHALNSSQRSLPRGSHVRLSA